MRLIDADKLLEHCWRDKLDSRELIAEMIEKAPTIGGWISVKDRLPEQHDTIFAKLKGTDKWKKGLFEKQSEDVRVVIEYPDGYRRVHHSYLVDGVWACETLPPEGRKVLYWCENPELPKEEPNDI